MRLSVFAPFCAACLLLLTLALEVLVDAKSKGAADQDDGVETDAGGGAVRCRGAGAGLCVALGLGVTLLSRCQLTLTRLGWYTGMSYQMCRRNGSVEPTDPVITNRE